MTKSLRNKIERNLRRARRKRFKSPTVKMLLETVDICLQEVDDLCTVYEELEILERVLESLQ